MIRKYLSILLILFCYCSAQSQISSSSITSGTDFWLAYRNSWTGGDSMVSMQIRIVTESAMAQGQITFTSINDTIPFQVSRGEVFIYNLTEAQRLATHPPDTAGIVNKSIHITSDTLINVFACLQDTAFTDATAILPITSLDTAYRYVSYSTAEENDKICIIATTNNTSIKINDSLLCTLQEGEVFYCSRDSIPNNIAPYPDLSAYIVSNYPIACFTMGYNHIVLFKYVPNAGDGIFEQIVPISMSGNQYFIPINKPTGEHLLRMVTNKNGTNIDYIRANKLTAKEAWKNNQNMFAGEMLDLVSSDTLGCTIKSNKPISVYSCLSKLKRYDGDPSQAWIPPFNLRVKNSTIVPFFFSSTYIYRHYAVVLTPFANRTQTTVCIGKDSTQPITNIPMVQRDIDSTYTVFEVPLYQDSVPYTFSNPIGGVLVWCLGFGYYESYYYLGGASNRKMEIDFTANGISSGDLCNTYFCDSLINIEGKVIQKNTTYPYTIKWYINGIEDSTLLNKMQWDRFFPRGHYLIKMEVLFDTEVGINTLSIEDTLRVTYMSADIQSTPEYCQQQNGKIAIEVQSLYPQNVTYKLNETIQRENVFDNLLSGQYLLTIQDKYCTIYDTIEIIHIDGPQADYQISDNQLDKGDIVTFTETSKVGDGLIIERDWDLGDGNKKEGSTIEHAYLTSGRYTVKLTVIDENNCKDSTSQDVVVQGDISFPNVYTPYGEDGKRYYFRPMEDESHYQQLEITIYNRWGNKIWHRKCQSPECPNYQEDNFWWDGTNSQGKMVSDGVYYWVLTAIYESPQLPPLHKEGTVTVINGK